LKLIRQRLEAGVMEDGTVRETRAGTPQGGVVAGDQLYGMELHKLMGTVKYPAQATLTRSSFSRVPENGKHGLKREIRNGLVLPAPR
jgi:hypothetical protein